ncbi:hypothetical protein BHE74_00015806, partial [Ensete ventricosum]
KVDVQSVFRALSQKFRILAIPNVLAHGKSYVQGFMKKHDGHKLCAKSRFDRFFTSWKFKILVIPNILAHGKSYEHGFEKKTRKVGVQSIFRALSWNFKILAIPNV